MSVAHYATLLDRVEIRTARGIELVDDQREYRYTTPKSRTVLTTSCTVCSTPFTPRKSTSKYCSIKCLAIYRNKLSQLARNEKPPVLREKTCGFCGESFVSTDYRVKSCSRSCAAKIQCAAKRARYQLDKEKL